LTSSILAARRVATALLGTGAALFVGTATAGANTTPGCTIADVFAVESQVSTAMAAYFLTHPEVNLFYSSLQGLPPSEHQVRSDAYQAANPQVAAEFDAIRSPITDLRNRCNIPLDASIGGVL
jgi:hemophore-related protein